MKEVFKDKDGNSLEKGILYDLPPLSWPLVFQGYESRLEGDFRKLEAVFWDFKGNPHHFNEIKIANLATPTTPEQVWKYLNSAHSLVQWLSSQESKSAQSQPKCTKQQGYVPSRKDLESIRAAQRD